LSLLLLLFESLFLGLGDGFLELLASLPDYVADEYDVCEYE